MSLTPPDHAKFVRDYVSRAWGGPPTAFRSPFEKPFAQTSEVFSGLLELGRRLKEGRPAPWLRFYRGDRLVPNPVRYAPRIADGTYEGYLKRLRRMPGGREYGMVVNRFQAVQPSLFARSADLLSDLYEELGLPAGGASLELFAGNYRLSPFGVHKDQYESITFVVAGRKRILLWPFETLREAIGAPAASRTAQFVPAVPFDHRPYRKRAVVLEGGPGDVLSWSREWWHVAESRGAPVTTVSLGLIRIADPLQHVASAAAELLRERRGFGRSRHYSIPRGAWSAREVEAELVTARRALLDPRLQQRIARRVLVAQTSAGLHEIPELSPSPRDTLLDADALRVTRPGALAWFRTDATTITLGARGRILACPSHPRLLALLGRLARGTTVLVGRALDRYAGRVETADTVFAIGREELRDLLLRLTVYGALVVVRPPAAGAR